MSEPIEPDGTPASVGAVTVSAPGLRGTVEALPPGASGVRAGTRAAEVDALLDALLGAHGLEPMQVVVLDAEVVDTTALRGAAGTRAEGTTEDPGTVTVEADDPGEGWGQVLLVHDEVTGALTWAFSDPAAPATSATRGGAGVRTYTLPVTATPAVEAGTVTQRGIVGTLVKKAIKVLAYRLGGAVVGAAASYFAARWEERNRPYGLHVVDGPGIRTGLRPAGDGDFGRARDGRALLLLHGTFSDSANGFGSLPATTFGALRARYPGGVFAFDHHTVSRTPTENVRWLLDHLPRGITLDVDVVTHSRGGLVGRTLAENPGGALDGSPVRVRRAVFVAGPHAGTPLADTDHMRAFIDTYTNLFALIPDNPVTDGIDVVLEVVKDLAAGIVDGLSGLQAMRPGGAFLTRLNVTAPPSDARYFAVAANYEPVDAGLKMWSVDRVADGAFRSFENDLVVPTEGAYATNGSSRFPIDERYVFTTTDGIHHTNYFGHADVGARLLDWLTPA